MIPDGTAESLPDPLHVAEEPAVAAEFVQMRQKTISGDTEKG